ncbi:aminotransferase class IV [Candidatus Sneabacter namystus]|nr:aminotransferase class IV [Candidatus Sneabacter namystus]
MRQEEVDISCMFHHSLHYGSGVFEGEISYNGKVFKIDDHTDRLFSSASTLLMNIPFTKQQIKDATYSLIERNGYMEKNCYVRPFVWRSDNSLKVNSSNDDMCSCAIVLKEHTPSGVQSSVKLTVSSWQRPHANFTLYQCKSAGGYNVSFLSAREAVLSGFDDAVLLDSLGYVSEASTSNIFFIRDGAIFTPNANCCLNGITRQTVLEIALNEKISATQLNIKEEEIGSYEAAFLTGTSLAIKPISSIYLPSSGINIELNAKHDLIKKIYDIYISMLI